MTWPAERCVCGKTRGHFLSPGTKCWPNPLVSLTPFSQVRYPDPESEMSKRIAAEWAHLQL